MLSSEASSIISELLGVNFTEIISSSTADHYSLMPSSRSSINSLELCRNPQKRILSQYELARDLVSFLSTNSLEPFTSEIQINDADSLRRLIEQAQEQGYTARFSDPSVLSSELSQLQFAFESIFCRGVSLAIFWTGPNSQGTHAHRDDVAVVVLQLYGEKHWRLPTKDATWATPSQRLAAKHLCKTDDVVLKQGDILIIPSGLLHEASSRESSSIHLSIGFRPFSVRHALNSLISYGSYLHLDLRRGLAGGTALQEALEDHYDQISANLSNALSILLKCCEDVDFVKAALNWERSQFIGDLSPLPVPASKSETAITTTTVLQVRKDLQLWLVRESAAVVLSYPGGHIKLPVNCDDTLRHITTVLRFSISSLPGLLTTESKTMLVYQLMDRGILEPCED